MQHDENLIRRKYIIGETYAFGGSNETLIVTVESILNDLYVFCADVKSGRTYVTEQYKYRSKLIDRVGNTYFYETEPA